MRGSELGDLKAFVAVAEERSFTRAAAKLGVSRGTVTNRLRKLEDEHVIVGYSVRLRPDGATTVIDVRSKSRVGRGDMGTNAKRIEAFQKKLNPGAE